MMKKLAIAIAVALASGVVNVTAQDAQPVSLNLSVMFDVAMPKDSGLSGEADRLLESKVEQILGRCDAGAAGDTDPFVVVPTLHVGEVNTAEGLVQAVASAEGQLTLSARCRYDDAVVYSTTVALSAAIKGQGSQADLALVRTIKISDPAYVRFVRNARKKAAEYLALHPELAYAPQSEPDPATPAVQPAEAAAPAVPVPVKTEVPAPDITYSKPGWKLSVKSCRYDASTRSIVLDAVITNNSGEMQRGVNLRLANAISSSGDSYSKWSVARQWRDYPASLPVANSITIEGVPANPGVLAFVELNLDYTTVEIRNLSVQ